MKTLGGSRERESWRPVAVLRGWRWRDLEGTGFCKQGTTLGPSCLLPLMHKTWEGRKNKLGAYV